MRGDLSKRTFSFHCFFHPYTFYPLPDRGGGGRGSGEKAITDSPPPPAVRMPPTLAKKSPPSGVTPPFPLAHCAGDAGSGSQLIWEGGGESRPPSPPARGKQLKGSTHSLRSCSWERLFGSFFKPSGTAWQRALSACNQVCLHLTAHAKIWKGTLRHCFKAPKAPSSLMLGFFCGEGLTKWICHPSRLAF